jgi:Leucine-rich repeat (LRR) protein
MERQQLDLSGAGLKTLPMEVFDRDELRLLNAYQNEISAIPAEIGRLTSLETLILANNKVTRLPESCYLLSHRDQAGLPFNLIEIINHFPGAIKAAGQKNGARPLSLWCNPA